MSRVIALFLVLSAISSACAADKAVEAKNGMVVAVSEPASNVGVAILKKGGNAVDAAVATAFALAVTYPAAGNIGGGGFMLIHPVGGEPIVIDYRETAPAAATRNMLAHKKDMTGHLVVGVPGTVRGLALAHRKYGRLAWREVVSPAIDLAANGFALEKWSANSLNKLMSDNRSHTELVRVFGKDAGKSEWKTGDQFRQPDLAKTLQRIALNGPDEFYTGDVADQIVAEMKAGGGIISLKDLDNYRAIERTPIHGTYRGFDVYAPPPPSSGGVALIQMLNILEQFDLKTKGRYSVDTIHLMTEAMRRAYRDRAAFLGDADFIEVPKHLTSKDHAKKIAKSIVVDRATPSADLAGDIALTKESEDTTHFSVVDKDGMAVSNTYTLENSYGSKVVVRGAGFLLNNEMTDFNTRPGVTDASGRIGTKPNEIAPGKRMLSSQTPTIIAKNGKPILVTGSPGGRTIINTVLCVVVNTIDFEMSLQAAVDAPRQHHQWFPDKLYLESAEEHKSVRASLEKMGHSVQFQKQGDAHSIWINAKSGILHGAADRRIMGKASGY